MEKIDECIVKNMVEYKKETMNKKSREASEEFDEEVRNDTLGRDENTLKDAEIEDDGNR